MAAAHAHQLSRCITGSGALHIQLYAFRHHLHVFFFQAGGGAIVTDRRATQAGVNTALVFLVTHSKRFYGKQ
jgi:hypothetical protein